MERIGLCQFVCFGEGLRITQDNLGSKNFYACNPAFDKNCGKLCKQRDGVPVSGKQNA